jgi:hypothetical protein
MMRERLSVTSQKSRTTLFALLLRLLSSCLASLVSARASLQCPLYLGVRDDVRAGRRKTRIRQRMPWRILSRMWEETTGLYVLSGVSGSESWRKPVQPAGACGGAEEARGAKDKRRLRRCT